MDGTSRAYGWNLCSGNGSRKVFNLYTAKYGTPDLIHAHSILWGGISAMEIARARIYPYDHRTCIDLRPGYCLFMAKPYIRKAINNAAVVLAVSKTLAGKLMTYSDRKRIEVIPNMVDTGFSFFHLYRVRYLPFVF